MINRRETLKGMAAGTTAAVVFSIVPSYVVGASKTEKPPSEKLNIAGIGIGGVGKGNLRGCRGENIVALCDVDSEYAGNVFKA